jgi:hypothetical protein
MYPLGSAFSGASPSHCGLAAPPPEKQVWLGREESNLHCGVQSPESYH